MNRDLDIIRYITENSRQFFEKESFFYFGFNYIYKRWKQNDMFPICIFRLQTLLIVLKVLLLILLILLLFVIIIIIIICYY